MTTNDKSQQLGWINNTEGQANDGDDLDQSTVLGHNEADQYGDMSPEPQQKIQNRT